MLKKIFAPGNPPFSTSLALLVLRVWLGLTMLIHHGIGKLKDFGHLKGDFADPFGIGHTASLALVVFAEVVASGLLVMGLLTRFAALVLCVNMGVAFFMVHKAALSGGKSGELAFIYLAPYVALFLAGAGKVSMDQMLFAGGGGGKAKEAPAKK
jgi:putative oxidoreductase